jgi:hypothetical protein
MNDYQQEQLDALRIARDGLACLKHSELDNLKRSTGDYLRFRQSVDQFLKRHFTGICTRICYQSQTSACCSKDGIITFFADMVINALHAAPGELNQMETTLNRNNRGHRCIYLTADGCIWTIRPVVCAMFLCDRAMDTAFTADPTARTFWEGLRRQEKRFKWPDRPVLFDHIEQMFMALGYRSSLMHLNQSPGLLRVKQQAGLRGVSFSR